MSIFADNIRYLRGQLKLSQKAVAEHLNITRGRYAKYEDGMSEPPLDLLVSISKYYHISIDLLLSVSISKYPLETIISLPDNRIVLPVSVDTAGANRIEIIPHTASMGYLNGYSDPEYIENLQTLSLPFLRNGNFRAFPASGDSMPPYNDGTYIIGKYVEGAEFMTVGRTYVFVTRSEGITYKRYNGRSAQGLIVSADNTFYRPYEILLTDLFEIWEFACSINTHEYQEDEFTQQKVQEMFRTVIEDINKLKNKSEVNPKFSSKKSNISNLL